MNSRKIRGLIGLVRPELPFAAGLCVVIGEVVALGHIPLAADFVLGFLWGFFLACPAMILNDYFDIEVDRINSPQRPLPSGVLSLSEARIFAAVFTVIGLVVSALVGLAAIGLYVFFWLVGFLYNYRLKELGLFGNLMVSSSVAVTLLFGGLVVGQPFLPVVWIVALMAFAFNLSEEIAADALDMEGDRARNVKSLAILLGRENAMRISAALLTLMIAGSYLPWFLKLLPLGYLIAISAMNVLLVWGGIGLHRSKDDRTSRFYLRWLYLSASAGMLALLIILLIR